MVEIVVATKITEKAAHLLGRFWSCGRLPIEDNPEPLIGAFGIAPAEEEKFLIEHGFVQIASNQIQGLEYSKAQKKLVEVTIADTSGHTTHYYELTEKGRQIFWAYIAEEAAK